MECAAKVTFSLVPVLAALIVYVLQYKEFWRPPAQTEPELWQLSVLSPIIVASFTPITRLASVSDDLWLGLVVATLLAQLCLLMLALVVLRRSFYKMIVPIHLGRKTAPFRNFAGLGMSLGLFALASSGTAQVVTAC
jgi:hypothetical protein